MASLAFASDKGEELLREVKREANSHKFAAMREIAFRDPSGSIKTFEERILRQGKQQRIEYPDDSRFAGQVVVEVDGVRRTYVRAKNEIRETRSIAFSDAYDFSWLRTRRGGGEVKFELKRGNRIAGEPTQLVVIRKDDVKRQALWVHSGRKLVLKREMYDPKGQFIGGFEFKRIDFDAEIPRRAFSLPSSASVISVRTELVDLAKELRLTAYTLPASSGYELLRVRKTTLGGKDALRQFFDAGKTKVTLVLARGVEAKGFSREGRANIYSWERGGITLMLIGDLDQNEMQRLARRVTTQQPGQTLARLNHQQLHECSDATNDPCERDETP